MRRILKFASAGGLGLIALLVLVFALLTVFDWNLVKPWVNRKASEVTNRPFAINGDLSLGWQRPAQPLTGWRQWVPWPHLRAKDISLGNPDWASTGPTMARVQQIDFGVNLLPLLRRTIEISPLVLTEPNLVLELDKEGRNNWTFKKSEDKSQWQLKLEDLSLTKGTVRFVDAGKRADIVTRIDSVTEGNNRGGVIWEVDGKLGGEKVSGKGQAGGLLSLRASNVQYPVQAELRVGKTEIRAEGTLTDPAHLSALDVELKILGASMAQLFPITGVLLPETPKFSTEGRVVGTLSRDKTRLRYEKFKGKVGNSDIGGTLEYIQQEPRVLLRGEVVSNYLNLKDLGALLGADSPAEQKKRGAVSKQPPGKALPVAPFKTDRWRKMDVQVDFTGKKIIRSENLPIDNLFAKIRMDNGVLALAPLNFGVAGGRLTTEVRIDGHESPAKARLNVAARGLKLKQLFPGVEAMRTSLGDIHGDARLTATGTSIAELLGSSNGEVKALVSKGSVSKFILEAIGLNVGSVVVAKLFGDRQVNLNCMASDFQVTDGLMKTRTFIIDTDDAIIGVDGTINLATEQMNLTIRPESKGIRIISLRSPLYVKGTFKKPDVGVDKEVVALKAGAAAVLGAAATPLAALLALINPGPDQPSPCGQLLAQARKEPVAPPPGRKAAANGVAK